MKDSDKDELTLDDFPEGDEKKTVKKEAEDLDLADLDTTLEELRSLEKDLEKLKVRGDEITTPSPAEDRTPTEVSEDIDDITIAEGTLEGEVSAPPEISNIVEDEGMLKLFIGYEKDTNNPYYLPFPTGGSLLHTGIFAKSGWGKTGLIQVFMEECAEKGIPVFYFSEKDDMKRMIKFRNQEEIQGDLVDHYEDVRKKISVCVFTNPPNTQGIPLSFNPFRHILTNQEIQEILKNEPNKKDELLNQREQIVSNIVHDILMKCKYTERTMGNYSPYLSRFINTCLEKEIEIPDVETLIKLIANPPLDTLLAIDKYYNIRGKEKRSLLNRLETLTLPPLKYIFSRSGHEFNVAKLIAPREGKTPINIFVFPKLTTKQKMDFIARALQNIAFWAQRQGKAQNRIRMAIIVDEAHVFAPAGAYQPPTKSQILYISKLLREQGVVLLVASQRLNTVDRNIRSNLSFQFFGSLNDIDDRKELIKYLRKFAESDDYKELEAEYNRMKTREFMLACDSPRIEPKVIFVRDVFTSMENVTEAEILKNVEENKKYFPFEAAKASRPFVAQEQFAPTSVTETIKELPEYYIQDIGNEQLDLETLFSKLIHGKKNFITQNIEITKFYVPFKYTVKKVLLTGDLDFVIGDQTISSSIDIEFPVTFFTELSDRIDLSLITHKKEQIQVAFDPSRLFNTEDLDLSELMAKLDTKPTSEIVLSIRKADLLGKKLPILSYENKAQRHILSELKKQWEAIINSPEDYGIEENNNPVLVKTQLEEETDKLRRLTKEATEFKPSFDKFKKAYQEAQKQLAKTEKEYHEAKRTRLTPGLKKYFKDKLAYLQQRIEKSEEGMQLYKQLQQEFLEQKQVVDKLKERVTNLQKVKIVGFEELNEDAASTIFHKLTKTERDEEEGIVYMPAAIVRLAIRTSNNEILTKSMLVNYYSAKEILGMCDKCYENIRKMHQAADSIFYSTLYICSECGNLLCKNHRKEYNGQYYCLDHFGLCSYCGQDKLIQELKKCEICGKIVCEEHLKPCDECGKMTCPSCGAVEEKKTMFGKKELFLCKRCRHK